MPVTITLSDNEADEVLQALYIRRHQKRTPWPGMLENVWKRLYALRCANTGVTPDPNASCYTGDIRVNVVSRNRW